MKICGNYKSFLNDTLRPRNTAITAAGVSSASPLRRVPASRAGYDDYDDDVTMIARTQGTGACSSFSSELSGTNYLGSVQ